MLFISALTLGCASTVPTEEPRIDGTSDASFDATYAYLVESLNPQDRRAFALALFSYLLPHNCLSSEAVVSLTFLSASPEDAPGVRPCRAQLHNKSYQDIVEASRSTTGKAAPNISLHEPPDASVTRLAEATRAPDTGVRELKR